MSRKILQEIIDNFKAEGFTRFFRSRNDKFRHPNQPLHYEDDNFENGKKLEEIIFEDGGLIVCSFQAKQPLSERSGKKSQYELGKKILRETQTDAGIFIFYDKSGNFRFSLIYANYLGRRRDWSNFRRFTYFVSKELTNKTFLQRVGDCDFSSLAKIKEAFSVEKVTKEFYQEIANWYFWAVKYCRFPKDAEVKDNGRNVAVIRLITRMIFIWFMRERGLVPKELFEEDYIQAILKDTAPESNTYYRAILQNLFFATLSTKKEERKFRSERRFNKGWNKDFGNQYVFRHHGLFREPDKIKDYFGNIPFLNGGLFECLDDSRNDIYIDGFTERKKEYQPQVPNFLFFGGEREVDLNSFYGTTGKSYKVRGLLNILSSFNFTIDENSPDDADIALDPELLGRVFENLLASYNPETATTARKATGSYYTPREIVDYMVTESLKEYFKTHLSEVQNIDAKLEKLFSTASDENPFTKTESEKLVDLIERVRIVDPAVGSGAFPMGALNKMVFILNKLDPGNELWKKAQLEAAEAIPDPQVRRNTKKQIEEFFKDKNADYGRKLYLIQKCIYGVDIQQIAVEIAKLRFFISLLVDETIDKEKENWGIEPLPNLDFKIMQGNSLISEFLGIDFDNGQSGQEQTGMLFAEPEDNLIKEFEQKKFDFQNESDKDKKAQLKNEVENLMIKIFETRIRKQKADYFRQLEEIERKYANLPNKKTREEIIAKEKQKLSQKTGFDLENIEKQLREFTSKNKTKPFFAWKLYFAEVFKNGGFDIVIANPPYIKKENLDTRTIKELENRFTEEINGKVRCWSDDLYVHFIFQGLNIARSKGIITYICNDSFISLASKRRVRRLLLDHELLKLVRCPGEIFAATIYTAIFMVQKINPKKRVYESGYFTYPEIHYKYFGSVPYDAVSTLPNERFIFANPMLRIYKKLAKERKIKDFLNVLDTGIHSGNVREKIFFREKIRDGLERLLQGKQIERWGIFWDRPEAKYKYCDINYVPKKQKGAGRKGRPSKHEEYWHFCGDIQNHHKPERLLMRQSDDDLVVAYQNEKETGRFYTDNTLFTILPKDKTVSLKYAMALLNSKLLNALYHFLSQEEGKTLAQVKTKLVDELPFALGNQKPLIDLVDKILAITKDEDYLQDPSKQVKVHEYEKQIDQLVYKLYDLTDEEIRIVEKNTKNAQNQNKAELFS